MNVENAIKTRCLYEISKSIGIDKIAKVAEDFGLEKIRINSSNQKKGIIPSKKWKKDNLGESWYPGETLISAIGQGFVLTNPLQLAYMTSIIASDGEVISPKIINDGLKKIKMNLEKYKEAINIIKKSMFKVVNESKGTVLNQDLKKLNFLVNWYIASKTYYSCRRESDDFRKKEVEWNKRDHALFVGYMPHDKPKYSISVVIEHGGSGASTAAPIAKQIFQFINKYNI